MSNIPSALRAYEDAVDALRQPFLGDDLVGKESCGEYNLSHQINLTKNWRPPLLELVGKLLDASFIVKLTLTIANYVEEFEVIAAAGQTQVSFTSSPQQPPLSLPEQAAEAFAEFQSMVDDDTLRVNAEQSLEGVLDVIAEIGTRAPSAQLSLSANLTKSIISGSFDANLGAASTEHAVYYLFTVNLVENLKRMSLEDFERDFCRPHLRTVIIVFDNSDFLSGDLLAICGRGHDEELKSWLTGALSKETVERTVKTIAFRKSESLGDLQTGWLTPDFLALPDYAAAGAPLADLRRQLKSLQALLSLLFLTDYIERCPKGYQVEYRGIGVVKIALDQDILVAKQGFADALFQLYEYAFGGWSADKLAIVQQFISLIATDLNALCSKATELRDAAQKTYATVLRNNVTVYFDALNKVEERLKTAVDQSSEGVISLSRDVSGDVYKIAGLIAAAIATMLLKPDFGWSVTLGASLVIAAYLVLVISYHLPTLTHAYDLGMDQHTAYIHSFREILAPSKIDEFEADDHLRQAKELFTDKLSTAEGIYTLLLIISLTVAAAMGLYRLWAGL